MGRSFRVWIGLSASAALLAAVAGVSSTTGQDHPPTGRAPASGIGAVGSRLMERVFVEPIEPTSDGSNARVRAELPARSRGDLPGPARGSTPVRLDLAAIEAGQALYAADLGKADHLIGFEGRSEIRRPYGKKMPATVTLARGKETGLTPFLGSPPIDPAEEARLISNCLMITNLGVVEDPERTTGLGRWTFGQLMTRLANTPETGIRPADFVKRWLDHWLKDQTIDSFTVAKRTAIQALIIDPWPKLANGDLDLTRAPFRLLAIVNRVDLRDNLVLGAERIGGGGGGEARFVFCAVDKNKQPLLFTVIFEFGVKKRDFASVLEWAYRWNRLKDLDLGTEEYNEALEQITAEFSNAGVDPESPPNRSGLSQLRTNEVALQFPWEIREFRIDAQNEGFLRQVTVKQTPDANFNTSQAIADFIKADEAAILAQRHRTPVEFPAGSPFLGGSALTQANMFWNGPLGAVADGEARHLFSLATCNGCHAGEAFPKFTAPDNLALDQPPGHFTQVRPRQAGKEARLSAFLTGKDAGGVPFFLDDPAGQRDPADPSTVLKRPFADLHRRAIDLRDLARYGAYYESHRLPLQMTH